MPYRNPLGSADDLDGCRLEGDGALSFREDVFDVAPQTGGYERYHHGDLDAYHVSYFHRM